MQDHRLLKEDGTSFITLPMDIEEFSSHLGCEKYFIIRQEMNKFMMYLNRSEYSDSWQDSVHNLYISLFHLENMEKELYSSDLSEEMMHQLKIVEKFHLLKLAIQNTISEIQSDFAG